MTDQDQILYEITILYKNTGQNGVKYKNMGGYHKYLKWVPLEWAENTAKEPGSPTTILPQPDTCGELLDLIKPDRTVWKALTWHYQIFNIATRP